MKILAAFMLAVALFAPVAEAQRAGQYVVTDFGQWKASTASTVAASSGQSFIVAAPLNKTAPGGGSFQPFKITRKYLVGSGSTQETVTTTSASCSATSCTLAATFMNVHSGQTEIRSGTYGLQEAIDYAAGRGGGTVIIPTGWGGTTAMITAAVGTSTVRIVDERAGAHSEYSPSSSYASGVGAVAGSLTTATESVGSGIQQTTITFAARSITVTDMLAYVGTKIYDFPIGRILILGSSASLAFKTTSTLSSTIHSGANMDWSVGTATASATTLATTMVDIVPKVDNPTSTTINVAAAATKGALAAAAQFDGTGTALDAYLNLAFPTGSEIDGDGTLTVTGTVKISWVLLGAY